jgi:ribosomal-protein-alanine N-acetyltransferase
MLVGKKVVLRTVREQDLDKLYDLAADVRNMGDYWPLSMISEPRWKQQTMDSGAWEEEQGVLLVTDHKDNILGQVAFFKAIPQDAYEVGFRIYRPENCGQGYMTEAVSLLVAFLFDTRPVARIQAAFLPGNEGSRRVLEKCGFQFEGVMRQALFHGGQNQDLNLYSIVRGESRPLRELLA